VADLKLKTALGNYSHVKALKDGSTSSPRLEFEHVEVEPIIAAFRRMVRSFEFDVSEMAISTYLCARDNGKPMTAIPVFPVRQWQHGGTVYNVKSGVKTPKDLEGKKVGVRAYTVTSGLWARGIFKDEYDLDLDKVTWVVNDEEHVQDYELPGNVEYVPGADFGKMLVAGELAAAIGAGRVDSEDVKPLIPNAGNAAQEYYKKTGVYPINHTVVVQNKHLEANPWLAEELFNVFKASKEAYLQRVASGQGTPEEEKLLEERKVVGSDPVPYGVEANRPTLEAVIRFNLDQHIISKAPTVEEIFPASTIGLK
jgi:4,5-dihydroxyphthalate decarboxylase